MNKLNLDLDAVQVESFSIDGAVASVGTVKGNESYQLGGCGTGIGYCHPQEDTEDNPTVNVTCPNTCWASCGCDVWTGPHHWTCAGNVASCMETCLAYTPGACTMDY